MKNVDLMSRIARFLRTRGLRAIAPAPDRPGANWTAERFNQMKRDAARRHMRHIWQDHTAAVLVVNVDRQNMSNYIGPNAFAEIGVAFAASRRVFLLQGMPNAYSDELTAWGVTCLDGEVGPLLRELSASPDTDTSAWHSVLQDGCERSMERAMAADI